MNVKAFDKSMKAQQDGEKKADCPYVPETSQHQEWLSGYEVMVLSDESHESR